MIINSPDALESIRREAAASLAVRGTGNMDVHDLGIRTTRGNLNTKPSIILTP